MQALLKESRSNESTEHSMCTRVRGMARARAELGFHAHWPGDTAEAFEPTSDMSLRSCPEDSELVQKAWVGHTTGCMGDKGGAWGGLPKPVPSPRVTGRICDGGYKRMTLQSA